MNKIKLITAACGMVLSVVSFSAFAQDHSYNPDNSAVNARDRDASEPTADQGDNDLSDRQIMQKIRQSVMADKSLSTYAHNVKIISENGEVTLKGPVRSERERGVINAKAAQVAGEDNVVDNMSVKHK